MAGRGEAWRGAAWRGVAGCGGVWRGRVDLIAIRPRLFVVVRVLLVEAGLVEVGEACTVRVRVRVCVCVRVRVCVRVCVCMV